MKWKGSARVTARAVVSAAIAVAAAGGGAGFAADGVATATVSAASPGAVRPGVGDAAPPLALKGLLQAPAGAEATWEALKGKVVVLEFWAMWCGPCVGAIPHLDRLVETFKDRPVRFIAVADEERGKIEDFLKAKEMKPWVGLDDAGATFAAYGVRAIPRTVVVDAEGRIAGLTSPSMLTAEQIEQVLAGGKPAFRDLDAEHERYDARKREEMDAMLGLPGGDGARVRVLIREGVQGGERESWGQDGRMMYRNYTLEDLVGVVYRTSHLLAETELPDTRYDLLVSVPPGHAASREHVVALAKSSLDAAFGISCRVEKRETDVYVLAAGPNAEGLFAPAPASGPVGGMSSIGKGELRMTNASAARLADVLESEMGLPVVDETGLMGHRDIALDWERDNDDDLVRALREGLGLELKPARRAVEMLVIGPAGKTGLAAPGGPRQGVRR